VIAENVLGLLNILMLVVLIMSSLGIAMVIRELVTGDYKRYAEMYRRNRKR
jgi:hypothetical protein